MKKILYLLILIMMINLFSSQVINTKNTKCLTEDQLTQIFLGLKQVDYLKYRLDNLTQQYDKQKQVITGQNTEKVIADKLLSDYIINNNVINKLQESEKQAFILNTSLNKELLAKKENKKFWRGVIGGTLGGIIITATTMILFVK